MDGGNIFNRSLIFKRAWSAHKIKRKHNVTSVFADELRHQFKISLLIGHKNYRP